MPQANWQKAKLLVLAQLLRQETDQYNPLTTIQLCERMAAMGYPVDRRILSKDIEVLNAIGIEVMSRQVSKRKGYYIEDRTFSLPELKILMDAVMAAGFITPKKTEELIAKIADLGGTHCRELLTGSMVQFNTRKGTNETIYYSIDTIHRALQENQQVSFLYFDLGVDKEPVYRREGQHYTVEPIALVYHRDSYYLSALSPRHEGPVNYRVDRMHDVTVLKDEISPQARELRNTMGEYTEQSFKMFSGPTETVTLEFDRSAINSVLDNFGDGIIMQPVEPDRARLTVPVQLSPTFWGWVFQFSGKVRIVGPEDVVQQYQQELRKQLEQVDQRMCETV